MTRTVSAEIAGRFHDLADLLIVNATVLSAAQLPEVVTSVRARVYGDVAEQLRLLADVEADRAEGNPLVVTSTEDEITAAVARRFELLAGQLAANARLLTARTVDAVLLRRAAVYRDVASQVRMLANEVADLAEARSRRATRPPLSNTAPVNPIAVKAAAFTPRVRPEFLESLVEAIGTRSRQGWSVVRLTRWLRTSLRDPQTDAVHPCAQRSFVVHVTGLLAGATHLITA